MKVFKSQNGQTLIETLAAIFILIMGITAAIGLAVYTFSSSTNITKQIVATGLAREGIEAVKNMRDTNWLKSTLDKDCNNFATTTPPASLPVPATCPGSAATATCCYHSWLGIKTGPLDCTPPNNNNDKSFCIEPSGGDESFSLDIDADAANKFWILTSAANGSQLYVYTGNDWSSMNPALYRDESGSNYAPSGFYRQLILNTIGANSAFPFNTNIGPRLQAISRVWWTDKKCPPSTTWAGAKPACRLELQAYLTNWKNY
ncbi:MAG: hypothetical protein NTX98_03840 [Candidatus Doudnabacteria bacterium]|nr:hypothetical protein [Candidatus Doudnabacteria bacterium]